MMGDDGGSTMEDLSSYSLPTIVSYRKLLEYEESLYRSPYSVTHWLSYLSEIDSYLERLTEEEEGVAAAGGSQSNKALQAVAVIGEKDIPRDAFPKEKMELIRARVNVAERSLALLPGSYKLWKCHLDFCIQMGGNRKKQYPSIVTTFERSLVRMHTMPRIWLMYLKFVQTHDPRHDITTMRRLYDRALTNLPLTQHDKIWDEYLQWAKSSISTYSSEGGGRQDPKQCTSRNMPQIPVETTLRILRRYALFYNPSAKEDLARTCIALKRYGEGATLLVDILNNNDSVLYPATMHDLWMTFTDVCTNHPEEILQLSERNVNIDFDKIIRAALGTANKADESSYLSSSVMMLNDDDDDHQNEASLENEQPKKRNVRNFGEIEGVLWCKLADYYIRLGEFEVARSIYEEAMDSVTRVRDFSLIFDAYSRFEEGTITAHLALMEEEEEEEKETQDDNIMAEHHKQQQRTKEEVDEEEDDDAKDLEMLLDTKGDTTSSDSAIELEMARAEHLMDRRPLLLNRVLLKQNPHNVGEWLHRADLFIKNLHSQREAIAALEEGCKRCKSQNAVNGNPTELFLKLVSLHGDDTDSARSVFQRVCIEKCYKFKTSDDMAQIWAAWVEFELKMENYEEALSVIRQAIASPSSNFSQKQQTHKLDTNHGKGSQGSQKGKQSGSVYKSLRLWNLALDLEESLGGFTNAKACYDRCIEVGAATPQIILNYANFLAENKYFEESFTAYEKGVSLFPFPHVGAQAIWSAYLKDFHKRYGGTKVERSRELYERCVENVIPEKASEFYLMYAKFEETYGLAKRALGVYERLCTTVPKEDKLKAYELYIAKAESFSGPSKTRPIYEAAIAALDDRDAAKMCLQYADLETRLGEIDRARTSLTYGAQMADPRRDPEYWKEWHTFEVAYGNEETFREMLRVKRGVAALFSTVNYNALEMGAAEPAGQPKALTEEEALEMISEREGVKHKTLPSISGFVSSSKRTAAEANLEDLERQAARLRQATSLATAKTTTVSEAPIDDSEINIESEDEEEEEEGETHEEAHNTVSNVTLKEIPSAVFGALLDPSANETEKGERATKMGALERLRSAALENK